MLIPAKAGISGPEVTGGLHETPAFTGVTIGAGLGAPSTMRYALNRLQVRAVLLPALLSCWLVRWRTLKALS